MVKRILILVMSLLCLCSSAFATNWQWVDSSDKMTISLNTDNITRINNIYTAWFRFVYVDYAQPTERGQKVKYFLERESIQKTETGDQHRTLEIILYDSQGNVIDRSNKAGNWESIIPGSFGETMFKKVLEVRAAQDKADDEKAAADKAVANKKAADAKAEAEQKAKKEKQAQRNKEAANAVLGVGSAILGGLL